MPADKSRVGPVLSQDDGLRVREKWAAGNETKPSVVLLRGAGMDGSGWDVPVENVSLVDALARNDSHTFALDFRGRWRSSAPPPVARRVDL